MVSFRNTSQHHKQHPPPPLWSCHQSISLSEFTAPDNIWAQNCHSRTFSARYRLGSGWLVNPNYFPTLGTFPDFRIFGFHIYVALQTIRLHTFLYPNGISTFRASKYPYSGTITVYFLRLHYFGTSSTYHSCHCSPPLVLISFGNFGAICIF